LNKHESSTTTGGIGFTGLLGIVFIVLKLTGVINWSWVWVLCPFWIGIVLYAVIVLAILGYTIARERKNRKRMERRRKEKE
jgi:small Trp-rich protein